LGTPIEAMTPDSLSVACNESSVHVRVKSSKLYAQDIARFFSGVIFFTQTIGLSSDLTLGCARDMRGARCPGAALLTRAVAPCHDTAAGEIEKAINRFIKLNQALFGLI
jgi:hypothetical protein